MERRVLAALPRLVIGTDLWTPPCCRPMAAQSRSSLQRKGSRTICDAHVGRATAPTHKRRRKQDSSVVLFRWTEIYFGQTLGDPEIWTIPTPGGAPKPLVAGRMLTPSADGESLYVLRPDGHIVRTTRAGSEDEAVFSAESYGRLAEESNLGFGGRLDLKSYPDGKSLFIGAEDLSGIASFRRLDLSTHPVEKLGELADASPKVSCATPGKSVYLSRRVNGITDIWEYSLQDQSLKQQTFATGPDRLPMAASGEKGVYFVNGKNAGALTLYRAASHQSSDIVGELATQPLLTTNGRRLAYVTNPDFNRSELWASDLTGEHRVRLVSGAESLYTLSWSSDDSKLLDEEKSGAEFRVFLIEADGTHPRQIPWNGDFVGFAIWEKGDRPIVMGTVDKNRQPQNWRVFLNGSPPELVFGGCAAAMDVSDDGNFYIGTVLWGDHPGIFQYSVNDKRCTTLKSGISTFLAYFASDGKAFLYSVASHGQTTIFRQPWRNGTAVGSPVPALKLPFALREDYEGNAFQVSGDLSSVVYARPGGNDDLYLLTRK